MSVEEAKSENWLRPSPRLLVLRRLEVAALTLVALIVMGIAASIGREAIWLACLGGTLLLGLGMERFASRRYHSWGYAEREDDLLVRRGVMFSRLSVVPYGRMQFIDVSAGPLERSFRLATVRMHTAAAASDARIPGLDRAEAARLRDSLAEVGEAQAAGL